MPKCNKCKIEKSESEFNFNKSKDRLEYHCKKCHSDYLKVHYQKNKEYYKAKSTKRVSEIREWFQTYKIDLKCETCGENHPACIEFHHTKNKELEVSDTIANGWGKERILSEIAKCKVLCSNCHRKYHWKTKTGPWKKN